MIKRNSIIIIGNGFDLAHNLPTSYNHFANHYIELISEHLLAYNKNSVVKDSFLKYLDYFNRNGVGNVNYSKHKKLTELAILIQNGKQSEIIDYLNKNLDIISDIIKNHFLANLYNDTYSNWFDIENAFFEELVGIKSKIQDSLQLGNSLKTSLEKEIHNLNKLNEDLTNIKSALKDYLASIKINLNQDINNFFNSKFRGKHRLHIINFNYTDTIKLYRRQFTRHGLNLDILNIHGNLNEDIIFGYGNDKNNHYQEMKDLGIDEFLENFKTFEYMNNNRYSSYFNDQIQLLNDFDVYIIGHSLQQTDKTLLSAIFNNERCIDIHILKRSDQIENEAFNSYRKLLFATSRIITDDELLRKKIINYNDVVSFPKYN